MTQVVAWLRRVFAAPEPIEQPKSECCGAPLRTGDLGFHYTPWRTIQTVHQKFCGACERPCGEQWRSQEFSGNWAA